MKARADYFSRMGWRGWLAVVALILGAGIWRAGESFAAQAGASGPKVVYILRHGEKAESTGDTGLSPRGVERAAALARVIPERFCVPDFIFATKRSAHSDRPVLTMRPLAKALHLTILDSYADDEVKELAHDLLSDSKYSGKTILICWHHGQIPNLARALGAKDSPVSWPGEIYDRVWRLEFAGDGVKFVNLPEGAMEGDSTK
jgi:hypothetical protein